MKKAIQTMLIGALCLSLLPLTVFAADSSKAASAPTIKVDGDLSDWAAYDTISIEGSGANEGKKATFYGVLTDEGLYLACDAYHGLYKTGEGEWWQNCNFEFFVNNNGSRDNQGWVSSKGMTLGETTPKDVAPSGATSYMKTTEVDSGAAKYHTVTEVFIPATHDFVKNNLVDGVLRVGVAWKTIDDKNNNGEANHGDDDEYWVPKGSWPDNNDKAVVCSSGIYTKGVYDSIHFIDSTDAWNDFADHAADYVGKNVVIAKDLDFTNKEFKVVQDVASVINGAGHTIKGVHRTVENAHDDGNTGGRAYGILINNLSNNYPDFLEAEVKNLTIEDCSINVSVVDSVDRQNAVYVGVIGELNRATVSNLTIKGVSIEVSGQASVGVVAGLKEYKTHADVDNFGKITISKTTVNAPNARVGILLGEMWAEGVTVTADEVNASLKVEASTNEVGETTFVAAADQASFNAPASATVKINPEDEETEGGNTGSGDTESGKTEEDKTDPAPTGSASIAIAAVAVVALAGVVVAAKKREQE